MHGRFSDANLFSQTSLNEEKRFRSRLNLSVSQTEQSYDVLDFDGPIPINRVSKLPPSNYVDKELDDEMINYKPLTDYTESKACANKALALSTDILNEVITLFKKKFCISQNAIKLKKACTFNDQKELDALNKFKYGEKKGDEVADEIPAISFMVVSKQESQESKISNETFRSLSSFDKDFQKEEKDEFDWPANNVFNQRMGLAKIQEFVQVLCVMKPNLNLRLIVSLFSCTQTQLIILQQTHNSVLSCWAKPISVKQEDLSTIYK